MKYVVLGGLLFVAAVVSSFAQSITNSPESTSDTRYGLFGWLDHRSQYGVGAYPEPFLVDDSDLEPNEVRLDWVHTEARGTRSDVAKAEIEKGFGVATLELEVPYERDRSAGVTTHGFANINLGARGPFYQYVSPSNFVDSTFGIAIEVGIPTTSPVSKNAEVVPKLFNDLELGNFTLQSILGLSSLLGPGDGGLETFEYGFVFGYTLRHSVLPLPAVRETIPFLELIGETELNKEAAGHNSLLGNAGLRFNLKAIGRVQPRPGIGFIFPIDNGAREDTHWGITTSLVFQF